jgi:hypothetical protein
MYVTDCPITPRQIGSYAALLTYPWVLAEAIRERTPPAS